MLNLASEGDLVVSAVPLSAQRKMRLISVMAAFLQLLQASVVMRKIGRLGGCRFVAPVSRIEFLAVRITPSSAEVCARMDRDGLRGGFQLDSGIHQASTCEFHSGV